VSADEQVVRVDASRRVAAVAGFDVWRKGSAPVERKREAGREHIPLAARLTDPRVARRVDSTSPEPTLVRVALSEVGAEAILE